MKLGAEIGVRLLRVFYWLLWIGEMCGTGALLAMAVMLARGVNFSGYPLRQDAIYNGGAIMIGLVLIVACAHYILTIPIGKKLAEGKADD